MAELRPADPGRFFVKVLADQHYQKGLQYERQGEWEPALRSYRRATSLEASNVLFLLARGHLCQNLGLEAEAEECYRLALGLRPDNPVALYNQAQLLAARGEIDSARVNLARIVEGGLEALGDRAAPILCRLGDLALRHEDYAAAAFHFRRALACVPSHRYAAAALGGLPRFAEFASPFQADGYILPKIALYGYAGAILLGMPGDDGIAIPAYPGLGFDSLDELAQTLARFAGLARRCGWEFDAVAALDAESQPLAIALAAALDARPAASVERVSRGAAALGVTATGADRPALAAAMATLTQRCRWTLFYATGLTHAVWDYLPAPQVVSLPVRLEFPWSPREASAAEHAEAFGAELAVRLAQTEADEALVAAQLAWYASHTRVRVEVSPVSAAPA